MRKRWRLKPGIEWDLVVPLVWAFWATGGFIATALFSITDHGEIATPLTIGVAALWGFGAAFVPLVAGLVFGLRWVWRVRPVERVTESVQDMREAYRQ